MAEWVLQIVGQAAGGDSALDGKFLREYDPDRRGMSPEGRPMLAYISVTDDPWEAKRFTDPGEAMDEWKRTSRRWPVRPDGKPNRPLTAFTVSVVKVARRA